ncbi:hypothetical protein K3495_g13496 [Podosphaera aphanis]|nr:hypothetical protein K3495_g13496 [Podosphaera aphanis]
MARFVAGTQLGQTNYMEVPRLKSVELSEIIRRIGDSIISYANKEVIKSKTTSSLEYLSCRPDPSFALEDWIGKLPKLKTLSLGCQNPVNPIDSKAISKHCPELRNMGFFIFSHSCGIETAKNLTLFSKGLKHNSLKKICISAPDHIGDELLLALKFHTRSLTHLSISVKHFIQTHNIDLLRNCKNVTSLCLDICPGYYEPEDIADDEDKVVTEMVDWIGSYLGLRELSMNLPYGEIAILTRVIKRNSIRLQRLIINDMDITNMEEDFIRALSTQTTLEYLCIRRNRTNYKPENFNWILKPLACLTNLKQLDICRRYEILSVDTISRLFSHLSRLEKLNLVTVEYTDEIWPAIAKLRHLKALSFGGLGKFTLKGILKFINTLHATNEGLKIRIFDLENNTEEEITEEQNLIIEQELIISQRLLEKVGGSFRVKSYFC